MAIRLWGDEEFVAIEQYSSQPNSKNWDVAWLDNGGYVIVWIDEDDTGSVRAQIYSGNGNPASGIAEIDVDAGVSGTPVDVTVTGLEGGNFAVVWTRDSDPDPIDVNGDQYARIFDDQGNRIYSRLLDSSSSFTEQDPAIARLGSGFVHVEEQNESIRIARYDETGLIIGSSVAVAGAGAGFQTQPAVATFENGNHVAVAWIDNTNSDVHLRIYEDDLTSPTGTITVDGNVLTDYPPALAALDNDRVVVVWQETPDGLTADVYARVYSSSGTAITGPLLVSPSSNAIQVRPDVTSTPDGGFLVTWNSGPTGDNTEIQSREYDSGGNALGIETQINTNTAGVDADARLTTLSDGRIVAVWNNLDGIDEIRHQVLDTRDGLVTGTAGEDQLYGNDDLNDVMTGLASDDRMLGLAGNDTMNGGDGDDLLFGNTGDDDLFGNDGADQLLGGAGADDLDGGSGRDIAVYLDSSAGVTASLANANLNTGFAAGDTYTSIESLTGTQMDDILYGSAGGIGNVIRGGSGEDLLRGYSGIDTLYGGEDDDVLEGGLDNDRLYGGRGSDVHDGGDGIDVAYYTESFEGVTISLANSALNVGTYAVGDTYISIENVIGTKFDDILNGLAGGIDNEMRGGAGDDELKGYSGDDALFGGEGNDIMDGGTGADFLAGGFGEDMATYENASARVVVSLANSAVNQGEAAGDTYNNVENVRGSDFHDVINGNTEDNVLEGLAGNDQFKAYQGYNTVTGGAGDDTFIFNTSTGSANLTTITDFTAGSDSFELSQAIFDVIPLGTLAAGRFASNSTGQAADASDRIIYNESNGFLYYDEDGNGSAGRVYFARLDAGLSVTATDFEVV